MFLHVGGAAPVLGVRKHPCGGGSGVWGEGPARRASVPAPRLWPTREGKLRGAGGASVLSQLATLRATSTVTPVQIGVRRISTSSFFHPKHH